MFWYDYKFVTERSWNEFQTIKNLAISLSLESNELLDHFQWLNDKEVADFEKDPKKINEIKEELADIVAYAFIACNRLNIDFTEVFLQKIEKNSNKYPAKKFKDLDWEADNKEYQKTREGWGQQA